MESLAKIVAVLRLVGLASLTLCAIALPWAGYASEAVQEFTLRVGLTGLLVIAVSELTVKLLKRGEG